MSFNPDTRLSLRDCVDEVLGLLTGLDLSYDPELDRFRSITRQLNRALRANALEREWSWYSDTEVAGVAEQGVDSILIRSTLRPRIINDDCVRLVREDGTPVRWAYFLPRDALHKYPDRAGLWASVTRNELSFSRPFTSAEDGLEIHVPVMREPRMFRLPDREGEEVGEQVLNQPLDFQYPDVIVLRAAYYYAQTDPVLQPRVQTLEAQAKDLMYQIIERDERITDSPFENEFFVPVQSGLNGYPSGHHFHPHADERRL